MHAGVLAGLAGGVAVLALTVPASAFNSGTDPDTYYGDQIASMNLHRVWLGEEGRAFESVDGFTRRMPDDEFDDQVMQLVNRYREDRGLGPAQDYEPLRTQSAMWSNRVADAGGYIIDPWYTLDARVVCHQLKDIFSVSSATQGSPQDVFDSWLSQPGAVTGLTTPDPVYLGSATVEDGGFRWVTLRIARGACPGQPDKVSGPEPELPAPDLSTRAGGNDIEVVVQRQGNSQLVYEVQWFNGSYWSLGRASFTEPGKRTLVSDLLPGQYRVVVPSQSGYGAAISETITVS